MTPANPPAVSPVDLTTCEREPIHIPGSIQPHGTLLVARPRDGRILQAAANAAVYLGLNVQGAIHESSLTDLFGAAQGSELLAAVRAAHRAMFRASSTCSGVASRQRAATRLSGRTR